MKLVKIHFSEWAQLYKLNRDSIKIKAPTMTKCFTLITSFLALCFSISIAQPVLSVAEYATGFVDPVDITNAGDDRLFIVEQRGVIKIIGADGNTLSEPFLDIRTRVNDGGNEQGLLGLAFPHDYDSTGLFYVYYTGASGSGILR